ncbi:hypothetical protein [Paracoccus methylarcula]|uniref:ABC transmembrane type-1 domain-containing protein n=1 Tax=Paracoccus methylarcula TaxID=72022 RepID=A0A422R1Q4_9RHOB|nr:hypothetical protein [Paracoccus methylarcula]RNF36023.1 hypothetical protein A7A09_001020 [Paracoccus methylarcula]
MGEALHQVIRETTDGRALRMVVLAIVMLGLVIPIAAGFRETGRAAFGVMPVIGAAEFGLAPWRHFLDLPGVATSLRLSLVTGLGASLLSLVLAIGFCATVHDRMDRRSGGRMLAPFLAAPHAAMAIGLAFVLAPSGWVARLLAPVLGLDQPPGLAIVNDPWGIALIIGLTVKEMPFLLLVILSALTQIPVRVHMAAGRALGYGRGIVWIKLIMPQVWPLIRLPVLVVIAYSLSVVDMAIILGPSNPPTLAVLLTRLFSDPDIAMILPASAGGLVQAGMVMLGFAVLWGAERLMRRIGFWWLREGGAVHRPSRDCGLPR